MTVLAALSLAACAGAPARLDTRSAMARTEATLVSMGHPAAGYASTRPPLVRRVEHLRGGRWGEYVPGLVQLSAAQPAACENGTLLHELAHDATHKFLLAGTAPGLTPKQARAEVEALATAVEAAAAGDEYLPNCAAD